MTPSVVTGAGVDFRSCSNAFGWPLTLGTLTDERTRRVDAGSRRHAVVQRGVGAFIHVHALNERIALRARRTNAVVEAALVDFKTSGWTPA